MYFPGNSVIHRLDSRVKLVLDILYLVILFTAQSYTGLLLGMLFMVMCYMLARIKLVMILKSVKPILPLMIFTGILNLFFVKGETPLFKWEFIEIYPEGVNTALFMLIRVITLIVGMSLLTYTTSPIMLTDAIERLLSPLKKIHVPVHELSMMMTIALRFIPTLVEETDQDNVRAEGPRRGDGHRRTCQEGKVADTGADTAVCFSVQARQRACDRDGMPLLPRRRGPYEAPRNAHGS